MDLMGATLVGSITAVGGGTLRDALVLNKKPFWTDEPEYIVMAAAAAAAAFVAWPTLKPGHVGSTCAPISLHRRSHPSPFFAVLHVNAGRAHTSHTICSPKHAWFYHLLA
jgi:hypothetical protein